MKQIEYKGAFFETLSNEQKKAGYIKFNIPGRERIKSLNGEGVWGWISPEDKIRYDNDDFTGKLHAILLNDPLEYYGKLTWGADVVLQCHGASRPTLDPEWVKEYLQ